MASVDSPEIVGPLAAQEILTIGPYHVLRRIGSGGQGEVFYCCHAEHEERPIALKLFRSTDVAEQDRTRFRRECESLTRLSHPNIAELYDAGEWESRPYLVMEFVSGQSITEYCHEQQPPLHTRLSLLREVCSALAHAHESGILHRDIKPTNVLVDEEGTPSAKVIDFGVCKDANATSMVTQKHEFVGTLPYASPEQVTAGVDGIDQRSDIYGLGLLMYEVLTGVPVVNRDEFADSIEVREHICKRKPVRPSVRAKSRSRNASQLKIPSELDAIILKSLEKDPERRYCDATVLIADIDRYLSGQRVLAQPPTFFYELNELIRSHKKLAAIVTLFMTLLAVASIVAVSYAIQTGRANERIQTESNARAAAELMATKNADSLEAVNTLLFDEVLAPPQSANPESLQEPVVDRLKKTLPRIDSLLASQPELELGMRERLGELFSGHGEFLLSAKQYERASELSETQHGAEDQRTLSSRYLQADALVDSLSEAELGHTLALELLPDTVAILGEEHLLTIRCKKLLASAKIERMEFAAAVELLESIVQVQEDPREMANTQRMLAVGYQRLGDRDRAEQLYMAAKASFDKAFGLGNEESAYTQYQLAILYIENLEMERGEALLREAYQDLCQTVGEFHANSIRCLGPLAGAINWQKRREEAIQLYLATIEGEQRLKGRGRTGEWQTLCFLARVLRETGDLDNADGIARYVLRKQHQAYGDGHPHTVGTIRTLASIQGKRRDYGQEALLHMRLLGARSRLNGLFTKEFCDAGRELIEAIVNWTIQQVLRGSGGDAAIQRADADQFNGKIPMVIRDPQSDARVLVWTRPTRDHEDERSLPISTQ